jgi:hypothetical protein
MGRKNKYYLLYYVISFKERERENNVFEEEENNVFEEEENFFFFS